MTPLDSVKFGNLLTRSVYDKKETQFLIRQTQAKNIPFQPGVGNKVEMRNKIMKEVKEKRFAEPFDQVPYTNYIQSPIGLVPIAGGKTRLIFHLSFDFPGQ